MDIETLLSYFEDIMKERRENDCVRYEELKDKLLYSINIIQQENKKM